MNYIPRIIRRSALVSLPATATLEEMAEFEAYAPAVALGTDDHREGVMAFREKRPPCFGLRR